MTPKSLDCKLGIYDRNNEGISAAISAVALPLNSIQQPAQDFGHPVQQAQGFGHPVQRAQGFGHPVQPVFGSINPMACTDNTTDRSVNMALDTITVDILRLFLERDSSIIPDQVDEKVSGHG